MLRFNREIQGEVTTTKTHAETSKKRNSTTKTQKIYKDANGDKYKTIAKTLEEMEDVHRDTLTQRKEHYYKETQSNYTKILNNQRETQNDYKHNKNVHGKTITRRSNVASKKKKHKKKSNITTTKHKTAPEKCPTTKVYTSIDTNSSKKTKNDRNKIAQQSKT